MQDYEILIRKRGATPDDTVQVCKEWLMKFGERFTSTSLVTTEINSGIAGNLNRGIEKVKGEWVKPLGGDDILKQDCIFNNIEFTQEQLQEIQIIFKEYSRNWRVILV